jgi:hypothetical protein
MMLSVGVRGESSLMEPVGAGGLEGDCHFGKRERSHAKTQRKTRKKAVLSLILLSSLRLGVFA